jgi:hypothetical protein
MEPGKTGFCRPASRGYGLLCFVSENAIVYHALIMI